MEFASRSSVPSFDLRPHLHNGVALFFLSLFIYLSLSLSLSLFRFPSPRRCYQRNRKIGTGARRCFPPCNPWSATLNSISFFLPSSASVSFFPLPFFPSFPPLSVFNLLRWNDVPRTSRIFCRKNYNIFSVLSIFK